MSKKTKQQNKPEQQPKLFGMTSKQMKHTAINDYLLLALPGLVALFFVMGWIFLSKLFLLNHPYTEMLDGIVVGLFFFAFGFTGIIMIFRREVPLAYFRKARGIIPILFGLFWAIFFWYWAIRMFFLAASRYPGG
jgi:hypothetical protein